MRKLFQTIAASDRDLLILVVGLLVAAGAFRLLMRAGDPVPAGKRVVTMCRTGSKRDRDETRDMRAALHAAQPDLHLKVFETSLDRKQDTMISAGVAPDLVFVGSDKFDYYLEAGALLDLTDMIRADPELNGAVFGDPAAGEVPDFYALTQAPYVRNGGVYALPVNFNVFVLFYNKDLFDKLRVPYPDENWDWAGLRERALALTRDASGRRPDQAGFDADRVTSYGFHYAMWQHGPENFIRQAGGRLVSDDGTRMAADDPRTVAALQFLYDLKFRDRVCPPGQQLVSHANSMDLFTSGRLGMYIYGIFAIPSLRDRAPDLDWDVAPLPRGPGGRRASIIYTNAWGISSKCADPQAAFRVLKFVVGRAGMSITAKHQVFLPSRRSLMAAVAATDDRKPMSKWALTHAVDHDYAQPTFATRQFYQDVFDCVNEHLDRLLGLERPPYDPAGAAAAMTREGNSILRRDREVKGVTAFGYVAAGAFLLPAAVLLATSSIRRTALRRRARNSPFEPPIRTHHASGAMIESELPDKPARPRDGGERGDRIPPPAWWVRIRSRVRSAGARQRPVAPSTQHVARYGATGAARREARWGLALISPWLVGFLAFAAGPIIVSIVMSFAQWQSLSQFTRAEFSGLENYRVAISGEDPKFWLSLGVTVRYAALAVPLGLVAGLALALLMNQAVRGIALFRTLYYLPAILPSVATAVLWWHLFDTRHGWVNRVLELSNAGGWLTHAVERINEPYPINWLESTAFTPWIFVVMSLWGVGGGMVIYLAGLQSIPTQLYEAAEIDGAGRWARLRHVTLPMLSPVILFNLIMGIIGSFQVFNAAFVLFDGGTGPEDTGLFYGLHLFREAFFRFRLGYASALAWILFAIILALSALVFKSSPMWVHYEASREKRA